MIFKTEKVPGKLGQFPGLVESWAGWGWSWCPAVLEEQSPEPAQKCSSAVPLSCEPSCGSWEVTSPLHSLCTAILCSQNGCPWNFGNALRMRWPHFTGSNPSPGWGLGARPQELKVHTTGADTLSSSRLEVKSEGPRTSESMRQSQISS